MKLINKTRETLLSSRLVVVRGFGGLVLMVALASCSTQLAQEVELAAEAAARVAAQQQAAQIAQQQEGERVAQAARLREEQLVERARLQAQREQQEAEERARAEQERRQREVAQRRERERLAVIAAAEALQQAKLERIGELENQIAAITEQEVADEGNTDALLEAISVAEELLGVLVDEQTKYEDTDAQGNTVMPLQKELIAELQARKDDLLRRARSQ